MSWGVFSNFLFPPNINHAEGAGRCVSKKRTCTQLNTLKFLQNGLGSGYSSIAEKERERKSAL